MPGVNTISIVPFLPGRIGSFVYSGTVHVHDPFTLVNINGSAPVFVTSNFVAYSSPRAIGPKLCSNLSNLTPDKGTHSVTFSEDYTTFVDTYSTTTSPPISVLRNNCNGTG